MPRNGAGTYTLPSGNPVVSGELIEANWANTTLADVANEITNSLDRNGNGGMLAPFRLADGTLGAPGIAWLNEPSTGLYRAGSGEQWAVVSGNQVMQFTAGGALVPAGKTMTFNGSITFASPDTVRQSLSAVKYTTTTGSALLPVGTTAQRDASPTTGAIRYNSDTGGFEGYNGSGWDSLVNSYMYTQEFSGDSSTTVFTLSVAASSSAALEVFISGIRQKPTDDYTVSSTTLTFVAAPPTGTDNIFCRWTTTNAAAAIADNSITTAKIVDGAVTDAKITGPISINKGGTGATTAATARTALGSTTVGDSMFTLTNPSAVTFPRFNADNTVSALDAASFRTAIGAGSGGGSVTTVSVASANGFAGSVANATTTPAITVSTSVTGVLVGNGTGVAAAVSGTDFKTVGGTSILGSGNITVSGSAPYSARTSNTIFAAGDQGYVINYTSGTFTQTLTAAATLGDGWYLYVKNSGTGVITLDPNASETIDGSTTIKVYPSESFLIECNGTAFFTVGRQKEVVFASSSGSGVSSLAITQPFSDTEVKAVRFVGKWTNATGTGAVTVDFTGSTASGSNGSRLTATGASTLAGSNWSTTTTATLVASTSAGVSSGALDFTVIGTSSFVASGMFTNTPSSSVYPTTWSHNGAGTMTGFSIAVGSTFNIVYDAILYR